VKTLTRGQLARLAHVNPETIRFYERLGLLPPPPRSPTGARQYGGDAIARLQRIKQLRQLGFALAEIKPMLDAGEPAQQEEHLRELAELRRRLTGSNSSPQSRNG
jgi:DNA-binding transcriptional MerR regulator